MELNDFIKAENSIHNQARIIGAIAKAFVPPVEDGSHTNMAWNTVDQRLESRYFEGKENSKAFVYYKPNSFSFRLDSGNSDVEINSKEKPLQSILDEFEKALTEFGVDGRAFRSEVSFRFPELFDSNEIGFRPEKELIRSFEQIRTSANEQLQNFLDEFNQTSEIRVWEHNFDTGIFCEYDGGLQQFAGYSPADEEASEAPYFYNSFVNKNSGNMVPKGYAKLSAGYWEVEKWSGAILPITSFSTTREFLDKSFRFLVESSKEFLSHG